MKKICGEPGCNKLIEITERYCEEHKKEPRKPFENAIRFNEEFYNSAQWRKLKSEHLKEQDYCVYCGSKNNLEVHHINPPRGDAMLFFSSENLQTVCKGCHRLITQREIQERRK
jgi:5-methylcytosine-specific restriction protein A